MAATGGEKPTKPKDDHHDHFWLKEWFLNKISHCPHEDSCGWGKYEVKDCDTCNVLCTKKLFTMRNEGYVCNSQSYCPCGSHSGNLEDGED